MERYMRNLGKNVQAVVFLNTLVAVNLFKSLGQFDLKEYHVYDIFILIS